MTWRVRMLWHKPLISFLNVGVFAVAAALRYAVNVSVVQMPMVYLSFVGEQYISRSHFAIKTKRDEKKMGFHLWRQHAHALARLSHICYFSAAASNKFPRKTRPTDHIFNNSVHVCRRWFWVRFSFCFTFCFVSPVFSFRFATPKLCAFFFFFLFGWNWARLSWHFNPIALWIRRPNRRKRERNFLCVTIAEFQYFNSHSNSCTLSLISPANFTIHFHCVAVASVWVWIRRNHHRANHRVRKMHIHFTSVQWEFRARTPSKHFCFLIFQLLIRKQKYERIEEKKNDDFIFNEMGKNAFTLFATRVHAAATCSRCFRADENAMCAVKLQKCRKTIYATSTVNCCVVRSGAIAAHISLIKLYLSSDEAALTLCVCVCGIEWQQRNHKMKNSSTSEQTTATATLFCMFGNVSCRNSEWHYLFVVRAILLSLLCGSLTHTHTHARQRPARNSQRTGKLTEIDEPNIKMRADDNWFDLLCVILSSVRLCGRVAVCMFWAFLPVCGFNLIEIDVFIFLDWTSLIVSEKCIFSNEKKSFRVLFTFFFDDFRDQVHVKRGWWFIHGTRRG